MTQHRYHRDPIIWLIFAVAVSVPSVELTRLLRERDTPRAAPSQVPRVEPAGRPQVVAPTTPAAPTTPTIPIAPRPAPAPPSREAVYIGPVDEPEPTPPLPARLAESTLALPADSSRFLPIPPLSTPIVTFAVTADGRVAAVLEESGTVTIWDLNLAKQIRRFTSEIPLLDDTLTAAPQMALVRSSELAPVQMLLAIGASDGRLRVWNALTGDRLLTSAHPSSGGPVVDIAWNGLLNVATVGSNGTIGMWHVTMPSDSALISLQQSPGGVVKDIDYNFENEAIVVAATGGVHILRKFEREGWITLDSARGPYPRRVVFSGNGRYLATAWSSGFITIHHTPVIRPRKDDGTLERGRIVPRSLSGFSTVATPRPLLAFTRDGALLAVHTGGRRISLHSTQPGFPPPAIQVPRGQVRSMWFTPEGNNLVVAIAGERYLRSLTVPPKP